jgi:hypothetical protein
MNETEALTDMTTDQVSAKLKAMFGDGYSSHSIKHGAVTRLLSLVQDGNISLAEVMRLSKHKELNTTLRYAGDPISTAKALGTQAATALLEC